MTNKLENVDFTQEQLIEIAFSVLKAIFEVNQRGHCFKSTLRAESILSNEIGQLKAKDMCEFLLGIQMPSEKKDCIFYPPEILKKNCALNQTSDVWTLGFLLLQLMQLSFNIHDISIKDLKDFYMQLPNHQQSLLNLSHQGRASYKSQSSSQPQHFQADLQKQNLQRFLSGELIDRSKFTTQYLDFLRECLVLNPLDRCYAIDLLSHPIFKGLNKESLKRQHATIGPEGILEKCERKSSKKSKTLGFRALLDIAKLKSGQVCFKYYLENCFSERQKRIVTSKMPRILRIRKVQDENDRFLSIDENQERSIILGNSNALASIQCLILKPDVSSYNTDNILGEQYSMKSSTSQTGEEQKSGQPPSMISDNMSTQSSFLDRISTIFSFSGAQKAPNMQTKSIKSEHQSSKSQGKDIKSQNNSSDKSATKEVSVKQSQPEDLAKLYFSLRCLVKSEKRIPYLKVLELVNQAKHNLLPTAKHLRRQLWIKLLPDVHPYSLQTLYSYKIMHHSNMSSFFVYLSNFSCELGGLTQQLPSTDLLPSKESVQVWNDIKRCEHLNPSLFSSDAAKHRLHSIILEFLITANQQPEQQSQQLFSQKEQNSMKKEQRVVYVQGIDSIAAVLYSEYYERDWLVVPMLRQIYNKYLRNFLDGEGNLCFKYSSLMVKRLLRYYDPELVEHFREIEFTANLYPLVNWIMTLFAHSVPLIPKINFKTTYIEIEGQLTQIWTSIFAQQSLEYFFYLAVAIFTHSKPILLPLDLNDTLQLISHLGSIIDVPQVLQLADRLQAETPQSFVQNDLIGPSQHQLNLNHTQFKILSYSNFTIYFSFLDLSQILKDSAYFQDRWWELDQLDYNEAFDICLLSAEDYLKRKSMLTIDIRPWEQFHACHIRGSYHMRDIHVEFIRCYRENYGDNVIVVVGDRETNNHVF